MPWISVGISLIATSVSATTFLGNPADVFKNNMTYIMCQFGGFVSILILWFYFIPKFKNLNLKSAYEILEIKFSQRVRKLASVLYTLHLLLRTGLLLYVPSLVLKEVLGFPDTVMGIDSVVLAILISAIFATIYTYFGGIKAVIWTDVLQFIILFGGGLFILFFLANELGGFGEFASRASEHGKTKWFDFSMDPSNARTFLSAGMVYIVFEVAIRGCDQQFIQRYMSCKDVKQANFASLLSVILGLVIGLIFYWIGAGLFVFFEVNQVAALPEGTKANEVFPFFILNILPIGVKGIMVAAIYSAAMSSLDSALTALSNTTVMDLLPSKSKDSSLQDSKKFVLVWGFIGTFAALLCIGDKSILTSALIFTSLFTGPLLGMFVMAFYIPKVHHTAVFYGTLLGMSSLLPITNLSKFGLWEPAFKISWPWNPLISLTFTLIFSLLLNQFLNKQEAQHG